jgi:hypothetical protein
LVGEPSRNSSVATRLRAELDTLAKIDPEGAAPGLAICAGLAATLAGDEERVHDALAPAARRLAGVLP